MSNIPLKCLLGAFAVVSITGCDAIANKGFCQKTDKGHEICIKEEDIRCEGNKKREKYVGFYVRCTASGISKDFTGKEEHWNSPSLESRYAVCIHDKKNFNNRIHCNAARHFGSNENLI